MDAIPTPLKLTKALQEASRREPELGLQVTFDQAHGHVVIRTAMPSQVGKWVRMHVPLEVLDAGDPAVFACLDDGWICETNVRVVGTWSALLRVDRTNDLTRALWGPIAMPDERTWDWVSRYILAEVHSLAPSAAHVLGLSLAVSTQSPVSVEQVERFAQLDPLVRESARVMARRGWTGGYDALIATAKASVA